MERLQEHILTHLWLAGHEGMDKNMETTIMGDIDCYKNPFLHS